MRAPSFLFAAAVTSLLLGGCRTPAFVDPALERLNPRALRVLEVKNETIADLESVEFGALMQRVTFGAAKYDVLSLLRASLESRLVERGYSVAPPNAPADATVEAAVEAWTADEMVNFPAFNMRWRLAITDIATGKVLYSQPRVLAGENPDARNPSHSGLDRAINRSVATALADLPSPAP